MHMNCMKSRKMRDVFCKIFIEVSKEPGKSEVKTYINVKRNKTKP